MYIEDRLYGIFTIDPILEKLIHTDAVQRLKYVHQNGASYLVNPRWSNTRFDHSIGVMLLIRKLGGTIEEQIAGLLHDVSHTAFSHVVDQVLKMENEDYHEQIKHSIIIDSEIPDLLHNQNYCLEDILDDSNWPILEQSAPHLCADRIDYTLRDLYEYGEISKREVENFINTLTFCKGKIHVTTCEAGEWFVQVYYKEVLDFFLNPLNIYSNHKMAEILGSAFEKEIINKDDFLKTDEELLQILTRSGDEAIQKELSKLNASVEVIESSEDYSIHIRNKVRLVDPDHFDGKYSKPISECSEKIRKTNQIARERALKGVKIKVISS
ncbi:HD domain-containing protein [Pseudalkalibacillus sp. A8]|uniref:HD domain-containing protein n=1 Tax=Pseudalkalibacillus sp. A8 TaxID=3382641 RepID=UPI0038B44161